MVDLNLAQFFTGGPQRGQGINPSNPTPMQRGQGGMLSGPPSHADKLQLAMSQLDQNNVEDLAKLAKILQATGDTAGAVKVLKRIEDIRKAEVSASEKQAESEQETKVRENTYSVLTELGLTKMADAYQRGGLSQDQAGSIIKARGAELRKPKDTSKEEEAAVRDVLLKIAKAQGNTDAIDFLVAGGDLSKAQDVLFRAKPKAPQEPRTPHASITKTEQDIYKALFKQDDKFENYFDEKRFFGRDDKNKRLILMNKAEEIYTADPKKGRKKAADEALTMLKYGTSGSSSTSKKANNNDPFGDA